MRALFLLLVSHHAVRAGGFAAPSVTTSRTGLHRPPRLTTSHMASGKGFGDPQKKEAAAVPKETTKEVAVSPDATTSVPAAAAPSAAAAPAPTGATSAGKAALERLRRERAEQEATELRRVRELLEQDRLVQDAPAAIPERVAQRMGRRMLPFVGLPLFLGMGSFVGFWYFATYRNMEFQPAAVATTTVFLLVVGLLGITYSVLSASWDPDREGDFLGLDEFKTNIDNIKAGLRRSRENALLREKLAGLDETEIRSALSELERKEKAEAKRRQSFAEKMEEELK